MLDHMDLLVSPDLTERREEWESELQESRERKVYKDLLVHLELLATSQEPLEPLRLKFFKDQWDH